MELYIYTTYIFTKFGIRNGPFTALKGVLSKLLKK